MKKNIILFSVLFISLISSCSDFLKETDKDQLRPTNTEHFTALILGEIEWFEIFPSIDYLTDNVENVDQSLQNNREGKWGTFTWQREIEIDRKGVKSKYGDGTWEYLYKKIAVMNYVVDFIDEANGSVAEQKFIKATALFLRAYSYFNLTNLYGIPYNAATSKVDLGVPIRLDTGIEQTYNRSSVYECYDLILSDLLQAKALFAQSDVKRSKWHPSEAACDLLLSRTYLYIGNWDKSIEYATNVITKGELSIIPLKTSFIREDNKEILYSLSYSIPMSPSQDEYWRVSDELHSLYDNKDIRKEAFFQSELTATNLNYYPRKYMQGTNTSAYTNLGIHNLRVSEAYLNRAEAYAHKNEDTKAVADITTLLTKRYTKVEDIVIAPIDVLSMVLLERRKELCFEECHRWFDLRRMKNRPEIVHVFTLTDESGTIIGEESYTLFTNDKNYTLGIPLKERENNPLIRNNERLEKLPL